MQCKFRLILSNCSGSITQFSLRNFVTLTPQTDDLLPLLNHLKGLIQHWGIAEFHPEASVPNYAISIKEIPESSFTVCVVKLTRGAPWLSINNVWEMMSENCVVSESHSYFTSGTWVESCCVSALHHHCPATSEVRRCLLYQPSVHKQAPPGSAAAPLLPRWSPVCHHPNKASYWLF